MREEHITARLIVPIAFDLARKGDEVVLGPGTKLACDEAVKAARWYDTNSAIVTKVFVSATKAPNFKNVVMGKLMGDYIYHQIQSLGLPSENRPGFRIEFLEARWFSTIGEVFAIKEFMRKYGAKRYELVVCVKDWHAFRTRLAIWAVFFLSGFKVQVRMRTHPLPVSSKERRKEILKSFATIPVVFLERMHYKI